MPVSLLWNVEGHDVVRCSGCGLVFLPSDRRAAVDLTAVYSRAYFDGDMVDGYADYGGSETILRHQAARVLRVLRRYASGGRLLEVGCAYGFFLDEARPWFAGEGIEFSAFAAEEARKRGHAVRTGSFSELDVPAAAYDLVCLFDCIEHLRDPMGDLRKAARALKPGGILALTTGDIGSVTARVLGRRWRLMTPPQHLFYFSRTSLSRMVERAGFEILDVRYPWKLVPVSLVLHQLSPRLAAALGSAGRRPLGLYVNLFDALLLIARKR